MAADPGVVNPQFDEIAVTPFSPRRSGTCMR